MAPRRKAAAPKKSNYASLHANYAYKPKPFVGKPFDPAAIAVHHDAVAAAPWLACVATPALPAAPSARLRVLCVLDGVEADHNWIMQTGLFIELPSEIAKVEART